MSGVDSVSTGTTTSAAGSPPQPAGERAGSRPSPGSGHLWTFAAAAIVIVVVIAAVAAYAIHDASHSSGGSTGTRLAPSGANFTISPDQYNAITFVAKSNGSVNGTIYEAAGLVIYLMTPAELEYLSIKGNVSGYAWTSGELGDFVEYALQIPVVQGAWDVVFLNPNAVVTDLTSYLVYITDIELLS